MFVLTCLEAELLERIHIAADLSHLDKDALRSEVTTDGRSHHEGPLQRSGLSPEVSRPS